MSYDLYEEDPHFLSPSSSTPKRSPPSKHTLARNRSTASLRGGTSSLAHELAVALLPEPTASSKLLAEEFGIEYDEGAEGIDDQPPHDPSVPTFAVANDLDPSITHDSTASGSSTPDGVTDSDDILDPSFHSPAPRPPARNSNNQPEADAMAQLSENLESTEQFLTHLRRLDTDGPAAPLALEALAADIISRLNETARDREEQVRELLKCEREFQRIASEVGGADALADLEALVVDAPPSTPAPAAPSAPALESVAEEEPSFSHEWEVDPHADLHHQSDESDESDVDLDVHDGGNSINDGSPLKDTFSVSPPHHSLSASGPAAAVTAPASPAGAIPHLAHLRTHTASLVSSLTALSEHAQVNGAATTDAGRKIRMLKNKLGGWRTDWDSAERSRARIERWEVEGALRVDGRAFVAEHLREFERVLFEANIKTQAIMTPA